VWTVRRCRKRLECCVHWMLRLTRLWVTMVRDLRNHRPNNLRGEVAMMVEMVVMVMMVVVQVVRQ